MKNLLLDLAALVWPVACAGCGAADRDLCADCRAEVEAPGEVLARDIGMPCFSAGPYGGTLRELVLMLKRDGRGSVARLLAVRLRDPLASALALCTSEPVIVGAPSRGARVRERGFRHVELLCREAFRGSGIPHTTLRALRTRRGGTAQAGLALRERQRNAANVALRRVATPALRGREVVLVDDVVTTGATLRASRDALERAGATVVAAITVCSAVRRDAVLQTKVARDSPEAVKFVQVYDEVT